MKWYISCAQDRAWHILGILSVLVPFSFCHNTKMFTYFKRYEGFDNLESYEKSITFILPRHSVKIHAFADVN